MQAWIIGIVTELATRLGSWLVARASEFWAARKVQAALDDAKHTSHNAIDARLAQLKKAYLEANDGTKATPDQREALRNAIADFIRNPDNGGV